MEIYPRLFSLQAKIVGRIIGEKMRRGFFVFLIGRVVGRSNGQNDFIRRGGSLDDMLDRFQAIKVSDLKVGEMIAVSSTKNNNLDRVTAKFDPKLQALRFVMRGRCDQLYDSLNLRLAES